MIDIDRFKQINDNHGHDVGDAVLRQSARILREAARTQDMVCRLGGEEFLVICPETDAVAAVQCAERMRKQFEAAAFTVEDLKLSVTVSIGGASRNNAMPDFDSLLKAADQAFARFAAAKSFWKA
jgi:diguanylate cyclase (GGDEF)-like protein